MHCSIDKYYCRIVSIHRVSMKFSWIHKIIIIADSMDRGKAWQTRCGALNISACLCITLRKRLHIALLEKTHLNIPSDTVQAFSTHQIHTARTLTISPSNIWSIIWCRGNCVPSINNWNTNSSRGSISPRRALRSHSSRRFCASKSAAIVSEFNNATTVAVYILFVVSCCYR